MGEWVEGRETETPCKWKCCFFFNDTATTEIYTLSLHDALPISGITGDMTIQAWVKIDAVSMNDINDIVRKLQISGDRKSTRLNSSHIPLSRMPSSA